MWWVVNATPLPLYTPGKIPGTLCIGGCVGPRAVVDGNRKSHPHIDINEFICSYMFRLYEPSSGLVETLIQKKLCNCFKKDISSFALQM